MMQALKPLKTSLYVAPLAIPVKELKSFLIGLIQIIARKRVSKKERLLQLSEKLYKGPELLFNGKAFYLEILGIKWLANLRTLKLQ